MKETAFISKSGLKRFAGLRAPYDEEDTTHIMKIERIPEDLTILNFWFLRANQDLYSGKDVELQKFHADKVDL